MKFKLLLSIAAIQILLIFTQSFSYLTQDQAIELATGEIGTMASYSNSDLWTLETQVTGAYPIYIDGINEISYYECKASTNGIDAGYVLINVNEKDLPIVESAVEGKALTEIYTEVLGHNNFKVMRYDAIRSTAVGLNSNDNILASRGFQEASSTQEIFGIKKIASGHISSAISLVQQFRGIVQERSGYPFYPQELMQECYSAALSENEAGSLGKISAYRATTSELKNNFTCGWHTPKWTQYVYESNWDQCAVGCGPIAWAVAFAYWHQFKDKRNLFASLDLNSYCNEQGVFNFYIRNVIEDVRIRINTSCINDEGFTWPADMDRAVYTAQHYGYEATCSKIMGSEYSKFDRINSEISNDKPVILLINKDGIALFGNHYVVIEACYKSQEKYLWKWHNRDVKYYINLCWGNNYDRKWICTHDWGIWQNKVYSSFSAYLFELSGSGGIPVSLEKSFSNK